MLPFLEPIEFGAGLHEELHLHLFELAHTEDELAGDDFVAECLSDLCDTEGQFHASRLLHVEVVDENSLCRFGAQVNGAGAIGRGADFGLKHEVELAYVGPVARAADGARDFFVKDDLLEFLKVHVVHSLRVTFVQGIALGDGFKDTGAGGAVLCFVETIAKAFAGLGHFLVDFLVIFGNLVFDEHVGAVSLFRVAVVYERVIEGINVAAGFPDGGVHEDGAVQAHDVFVQQDHGFPPVLFDIVFQFHAVLTIVVDSAEAIVNVAGGEYETVLLAMGNDFLEYVFLSHACTCISCLGCLKSCEGCAAARGAVGGLVNRAFCVGSRSRNRSQNRWRSSCRRR